MEQLTLHNPLLVALMNNAATNADESYVYGLWNSVLTTGGFTMNRGYGIFAEMKTPEAKRTDLVLRLILSNTTVMVIECKSSAHDKMTGWDMAGNQLSNYLRSEGCRYGVVAVGHKCKFYEVNDQFVLKTPEMNWAQHITQIVEQLTLFSRTHTFRVPPA